MVHTLNFIIVLAATLMVYGTKSVSAQGDGSNHAQNIQTNNGISVQVNVEHRLRRSAAQSGVDERGWMRLLTPAHEESPKNTCPFKAVLDGEPKPLMVLYGSNVASCQTESCVIVAGDTFVNNRVADIVPLITIHKVKSGLLLDIRVFDKDGNINANIVDNRPHLNRNFVSDFNRPDEHSLWVKDNHDHLVLSVRLLNSNSLRIEGIFNLPEEVRVSRSTHNSVQISKDSLTLEPAHTETSYTCSENVGGPVIGFSDNP